MAAVKNITPDVLSLFRSDAPPVQPGDEVTIRDENFVGRAWPRSTWAITKKPGKEYVDASTEDAHLFVEKPETPAVDPKPEGGDES